MTAAEAAGAGSADGQDAECLLKLASAFAAVAVPGRAPGRISLDSLIGTEIGLDSLGVVELQSRVEQAFEVVLPDEVLAVGTLRDWLAAVRIARRGAGPVVAATEPSRAGAGLAGPSAAEATAPDHAVPAGAETLSGALAWHADSHPARMCIRVLQYGGGSPGDQKITYGDLAGWSREVARRLREGGIAPGDRVAIMLPTCAAFFSAFMGTVMAGGVAVPVYPPSSRVGLDEHVRRQAAILTNAGASVLITVPADDVFVSWLPLYHDMGLIGAWLAGLRFGFPLVVMSPLAFLSRPARWLQAISRYRGTLSAAPNFGFELCTRQVPSAELEDLDLSCWRLAFDGSEAVSAETLRRFAARFAACGLRPQTLAPAYGLAEAGVGVTFPPAGRAPLTDVIDRELLARTGRAVPVRAHDRASLEVVACGQALPGYRLRVADSAGARSVTGERARSSSAARRLRPAITRTRLRPRRCVTTAGLLPGIWATSPTASST